MLVLLRPNILFNHIKIYLDGDIRDNECISRKTIHDGRYSYYGYWDGMHQRETGGEGEGAKDIFITTFHSDELDTGDLSRGTFNNLFTELYRTEPLDVEFKDCSEGGISAIPFTITT